MKNIFIEKKVFFPNPLLSVGRNFSCFRWNFYGRVAKSFFYVRRTFHGKIFFEKNTRCLRILSDLFLRFSMKLQQSCKNFTLCVSARGLFWGETFVLKKVQSKKLFRTASEKFRPNFSNIFRRFRRKFFTEKSFLFRKSCLLPVNAGISSG